jgi:phosphoglycerol transferase
LRKILTIGALLAVCAISLYVTYTGDRYPPFGTVQLAIYGVAVALGGLAIWRRMVPAYLWVILAAAAMIPFVVLLRMYGFVDPSALSYHLQYGISNGSLSESLRPLTVSFLLMFFYCIAVYNMAALLNLRKTGAVMAALVLVVMNPAVWVVYAVAKHKLVDWTVEVASLNLVQRLTAPQILDAPDHPNIIVIYLEGMERGYGESEVFGDIYDPIWELASEGLQLTNIEQIEATGWSIAGAVATQCGVPLLPNGLRAHNLFYAQTEFLNGRTCLGDVLSSRGYWLEFISGIEVSFAGTNHFYTSHRFDRLQGNDAIVAAMPPADVARSLSEWVFDDQIVFEMAQTRVLAMAAADRPFGLVIETFGAHGPRHVLSRRCSPNNRAAHIDDMRPVVQCSADLTRDFVRFVQAQPGLEDTVFAIMSDHLGHDIRLQSMLVPETRRNTVVFLGAGHAGEVIGGSGSMIDVFPTFLDYIGLLGPNTHAGLGVSLF